MVESAQSELAYFAEVDFDVVKISVKASNVPLMVEAYRQLSEVTDHPLHLGVTEAGPPPPGLLKGTAGTATLLLEGIGDTIRYSLPPDPVEEARPARPLPQGRRRVRRGRRGGGRPPGSVGRQGRGCQRQRGPCRADPEAGGRAGVSRIPQCAGSPHCP